MKFLFVRSSVYGPCMASNIASSSSPSISTLSMAATGTLAVLAAPDAFLYRLKKFLICRGGSMEVKIGYNFKNVLGIQVVCFLVSKLQLAKLCIW